MLPGPGKGEVGRCRQPFAVFENSTVAAQGAPPFYQTINQPKHETCRNLRPLPLDKTQPLQYKRTAIDTSERHSAIHLAGQNRRESSRSGLLAPKGAPANSTGLQVWRNS